jgi:hypothetical protein
MRRSGTANLLVSHQVVGGFPTRLGRLSGKRYQQTFYLGDKPPLEDADLLKRNPDPLIPNQSVAGLDRDQ